MVLGFAGSMLFGVGLSPELFVVVLSFVVLLVLPIGTEILWRGRSPGKAVFGLRVVGADGAPEWMFGTRIDITDLLRAERAVVLWLVPSNTILDQTVDALRDPRHPYRRALELACGAVEVMAIEEALRLSRATVDGQTVVIVATIQSFRVEDTTGRKVYDQNGTFAEHLLNLPADRLADLLPGADGKPRELHIDKAVEVTDTTPSQLFEKGNIIRKPGGSIQLLFSCEYFSASLNEVSSKWSFSQDKDGFFHLLAVRGEGTADIGGEHFIIKKGTGIFVPAGEYECSIKGNCSLIMTDCII